MPQVPYTKPPLDYAAHLQQLKNRGLIIADDARALHLLSTIGYYRLSVYWYPMLDQPKTMHVFKAGSTFDNAFQLYCFDRELRKIVTGELEKIEVGIRSKMIYELSHRHGTFWYTNATLFRDPAMHALTIQTINQEYGRTDEKFIAEFRKNYSNPLPPSWMMLELTSFGTVSTLYNNMASARDSRDIAHHFGLDDTTFRSRFHTLVYVRNVCAHHSRLWNRIMRVTPTMPLTPAFPWIGITILPNPIPGRPPIKLNNRLYFVLSMIIYLLNTVNPNQNFKSRFRGLLAKYPNADVKAMGFPTGWETEPLWDWMNVRVL